MEFSISLLLWTGVLVWIGRILVRVVYNVFLHPLKKFPGPLPASATEWWKTWIEVMRQESMTDVLVRLHKQYGLSPKLCPSPLTDLI
jgi:hypothetical protein